MHSVLQLFKRHIVPVTLAAVALLLLWLLFSLFRYAQAQRIIKNTPPRQLIITLRENRFDVVRNLGSALHNAGSKTKVKAAWALGQTRGCAAISHLVKGLSDVKPYVQQASRTALEKKAKKCREELYHSLATMGAGVHGELLSQVAAATATPRDTTRLRRILQNGSLFGRAYAADVIASLKDSGSIGLLENAVTEEKKIVQLHAIRALGKLASSKETRTLMPFVHAGSPDLRAAAADAFGTLGGDRAISGLVYLLDDTDTSVVLAAVRGLKKTGAVKGCEPLRRLIEEEPPVWFGAKDTLVAALNACCRNGNPDMLFTMLESKNKWIRAAAVHGLATAAQAHRYEKALTDAAVDPSYTVRSYAIEALGTHASAHAVSRLCSLAAHDSSVYIRREAVRALGKTGSRKARDSLLRLMQRYLSSHSGQPAAEVSHLVAQEAAAAVGTLAESVRMNEKGVVILRKILLQGAHESIRCNAAAALGKIGGLKAREALAEVLSREKPVSMLEDVATWDARICAAKAMARDTAAVHELRDVLYSIRDTALQIALVEAIGKTGSTSADQFLRELAGTGKETHIRNAAEKALR